MDAKSGIRIQQAAKQFAGLALARAASSKAWVRSNGKQAARTQERDEGQWRGGRQISGAQVWPGGRYDGQFADSLPGGRGILSVGDARYEGSFFNGKPNGKGKLTNASGSFDGDWADGCFNDGKHRAAIGVSLPSCP